MLVRKEINNFFIKEQLMVEGIYSKVRCKAAQYGYKENKAVMDDAKEGLKNCKNHPRPEDCRKHFEARIRVTEKPLQRGKEQIKRFCK